MRVCRALRHTLILSLLWRMLRHFGRLTKECIIDIAALSMAQNPMLIAIVQHSQILHTIRGESPRETRPIFSPYEKGYRITVLCV